MSNSALELDEIGGRPAPEPVTAGSALDLGEAVRSGRHSAIDAVMDALAAIATINPVLRFATATHAGPAWVAAHGIDATPPPRRGRLAGVPILVKTGTPPHAPIVDRLVGAGAVVVGESSRPRSDGTFQTWGWTEQGTTRNPWDTQRSPGGSSAGAAAAVAARVVRLATGGDSAGSLRIPAAYSGVVGFKGTTGRVPRATGRSRAALTESGVVGTTVADVASAMSIASGTHPCDPTALPHWPDPDLGGDTAPLRVAFSADLGFVEGTDPGVAEVVSGVVNQLAEAGLVEIVETPVALADPYPAWTTLYAWERGADVDAPALTTAHRLRRHNDAVLADLFTRIDVLVTPTTPTTAHTHDRPGERRNVDLCWAFNLSGHPAASVPAGLSDGLPVGLQAVAAPHRDDVALLLAALVEVAVPMPLPPVCWQPARDG